MQPRKSQLGVFDVDSTICAFCKLYVSSVGVTLVGPMLHTLDGVHPFGLARAKAAAQRDANAQRLEALLPWPKALQSWCISHVLRDPRDLPLLQLLCNVAIVPFPTAALLYALPTSHILGAAWFALCYACFLQRFLLALHYSEHRPIFAKGITALPRVHTPPHFLRHSLESAQPHASLPACALVWYPTRRLPPPSLHYAPRGASTAAGPALPHPAIQEDNGFPLDLSSTEPFQRDSWLHFMIYAIR